MDKEDLLAVPELAAIEYLFETEEGIELLIEAEELLLELSGFSRLETASFMALIAFVWPFALAIGQLLRTDPFQLLLEESFWKLLLDHKLIYLVDLGAQEDDHEKS